MILDTVTCFGAVTLHAPLNLLCTLTVPAPVILTQSPTLCSNTSCITEPTLYNDSSCTSDSDTVTYFEQWQFIHQCSSNNSSSVFEFSLLFWLFALNTKTIDINVPLMAWNTSSYTSMILKLSFFTDFGNVIFCCCSCMSVHSPYTRNRVYCWDNVILQFPTRIKPKEAAC